VISVAQGEEQFMLMCWMWFRVSRASCFGEGDMSFDGEVSAANLNVQGILLFWFVIFLSSAVCSLP
jgi:hypothetical protein